LSRIVTISINRFIFTAFHLKINAAFSRKYSGFSMLVGFRSAKTIEAKNLFFIDVVRQQVTKAGFARKRTEDRGQSV
jgi:hypothetical protein